MPISTDTQSSRFYLNFVERLEVMQNKVTQADSFHRALYYTHTVTLAEKYLYDVFLDGINADRTVLVRLAGHKTFKNKTFKAHELLHKDIESLMIHVMKGQLWHRINIVEGHFRTAFGIRFNMSNSLLEIIDRRHHLVHRDGYDLQDNRLLIGQEQLLDAIEVTGEFIKDIDKKYQTWRAEQSQ